MATVTIEEFRGTASVQLDAAQARMFEDEIRRVRGGWLMRVLNRLTTPRVDPHLVAPDCLVRVDDRGRQSVYELSGGYILRKEGEATHYSFYLGLLMLEWLYGPNP